MKGLTAASLTLVAVTALGCVGSVLERPAPQRSRFLLAAAPPDARESASPATLWVDRVRVSPLFSGTGFVYRMNDSVYGSDFLHEFFAPPGDVLREAIIEWLRGAGSFGAIERSGESSPEYRLESDVDQFYADLRDPSDPRVVVDGRFRLFDLRSGRSARLLDLRLIEEEAAEDRTPQALVDAWNRVLTRALERLDREMRGVIATSTIGNGR